MLGGWIWLRGLRDKEGGLLWAGTWMMMMNMDFKKKGSQKLVLRIGTFWRRRRNGITRLFKKGLKVKLKLVGLLIWLLILPAQPPRLVDHFGGPHRRKLMSFSGSSGLGNDTTAKFIQDQPLSGIDGLRNPTWREWSLQRAGIAGKEFEDISGYGTLEIRNKSNELDRRKESRASGKDINHNEIRDRLEHLKLELSSVLQSLRSNVDEVLSREGDESSIDNFHKLSDASEFQENEISNAQDKLRSLRARLAVLEGKMTLAIIDAQKTVEEKQKRIDDARRALQLLRTACIVWPNSGSEVLLAGSFDGWATKRKMEKSSTGVFSLQLKLYPGKYEIKFIVDGEWKLDPLRPIVNNNGFENNLLIIT
uniref:AMP-activated protein kinase glycogen-binding domain-containing protein n=1 Tax=Gossypium raimondii TaxID=29730 RepID=A0A0D2NF98_GOSRA|nr:hypothetical protein B456_005G189700 [Gossypium raimondii]